MKDNKYQEFMSQIEMTPEMKKEVLEAVEKEITLEKEKEEKRPEAEAKTTPAGKSRRSKVFRIAGFAAAACLLLLIGSGLGISMNNRSRTDSSGGYYSKSNSSQDYGSSGSSYESANGSQTAGYDSVTEDYAVQEVSDEESGYATSGDGAVDAGSGSSDVNVEGKQTSDQNPDSGMSSEKLVYTCHVTVETENYQDSIRDIRESIKKSGGFLESEYEYGDGAGYNYNSSTPESRDVSIKHNKMVIRIPMDRYESFIGGVTAFGNVTEKSQDVENITKRYHDTQTRIKALKTQEKRLLEMMEKAESISDMITVEDRLTEVQAELESYQNALNEMDTKVTYATIEMNLHQVKHYTEVPGDSFGERMKNQFKSGIDTLVGFFEGLLFLAAFLIPLIPIFAIIALIVYLIRRWRIRRKFARENGLDDLK